MNFLHPTKRQQVKNEYWEDHFKRFPVETIEELDKWRRPQNFTQAIVIWHKMTALECQAVLEYGATEEDRHRIVETIGEELTGKGRIKIENTKQPVERETDEGVQWLSEQIKGVAWGTEFGDTNTWKRE